MWRAILRVRGYPDDRASGHLSVVTREPVEVVAVARVVPIPDRPVGPSLNQGRGRSGPWAVVVAVWADLVTKAPWNVS